MNTTDWKILYLTQAPMRIRRQLAGETLSREQAGSLRDDVSTDEITPVHILSHYDDTLGDFAHTGLRCEGLNPIGRGVLRKAGFAVLVAGRRYGKGSSREHSPAAEKLAGVQLVFAESFERIYRQNADNIGLFTSTDFGLLDRIERGEAITLADLLQGREPLAASILSAGGLLLWGQRFLSGNETSLTNVSLNHNTHSAAGATSHTETATHTGHAEAAALCGSEPLLANAAPQTLFEKNLTRHRLQHRQPPLPQPRSRCTPSRRRPWRLPTTWPSAAVSTPNGCVSRSAPPAASPPRSGCRCRRPAPPTRTGPPTARASSNPCACAPASASGKPTAKRSRVPQPKSACPPASSWA